MSATPSRSYYLWNIGCQMNKADAWRLADACISAGIARYAPRPG